MIFTLQELRTTCNNLGLDNELMDKMMEDIMANKSFLHRAIPIEGILKEINDYFKVDILQRTKKSEFVRKRLMFYYISRNCGYSFNEIEKVAKRDHSTILHAVRYAERDIEHYKIQEDLDRILMNIKNRYCTS